VEPFIGEIRMFAFEYPPSGWARADGSLVPLDRDHQTLFSLLGTQFGGDGTTNFALPDLRGHMPISQGSLHFCIALRGVFPGRD